MRSSKSVNREASAETLLRSFLRLVSVAILSFVSYLTILIFITRVQVGGEPLIRRVLPLAAPGGVGFSLQRLREASKTGNLDILFIGPSQCYRSFDTRWFQQHGLKTFNLGTTAQSPVNTYHLLKANILDMKPRLVILAVSQHAMATDGVESLADLVSNKPVDPTLIGMTCSIGTIPAVNLLIAGAIRDLFGPLKMVHQNNVSQDVYIPGGYVESSRTFKSHDIPNNSPLHMQQMQKEYLNRCLALLEENKIPCVCLSTSITVEIRNKITNYEKNQSVIEKSMSEAQVPYLDLNSELKLSWDEHFFDELHLNKNGVRLTCEFVLSWLNAIGKINSPSPNQS